MAQLSEEAIGSETVEERDAAAPVEQSGLFEAVERASFPYVQRLDREGFVDLVLSRSYCAVLTPEERTPVLDRVERIFDEHAVDGMLDLPYVTECFRAVGLTLLDELVELAVRHPEVGVAPAGVLGDPVGLRSTTAA